jgi:predicted ATP-dependent endonuclease of OLD family
VKLSSLRIKNLRSCKDVTVHFNPYTCLVGPNGAGKSTVLTALNVFFRETQQIGLDSSRLVREDFHLKDTTEPITITLTFIDLSPEAQEDFKDYYRNGRLVITTEAVFDAGTQRAVVQQYGERLVMPEFAAFFKADADGAKVSELKEIYLTIRETINDLPAPGTKEVMVKALRENEKNHQDRCKLLRSKDEFYGITKGTNRLQKYLQWVYVPAVKDASTEQVEQRTSALGLLLARTVRAKTKFAEQVDTIRQKAQKEYEGLLQKNQQTLNDLSANLQKRLTNWSHPEATLRLEWRQDPEKAVAIQEPAAHIIAGEDAFEGELCRLGHGLQRSYLLALLQELAATNDTTGPTLLLGCEEPELYQHPPQARHLYQVFQTLAQQNTQVVVSTHSPHFVSGQLFEDVRLVQKDPITKASRVTSVTFDQIAHSIAAATAEQVIKPVGMQAKLNQALQANLNEMFFTQRLIIVEGLEDVAYITAYLHLTNRWDEYRRHGCHMIAADGKDRIIQPLAIANAIGIRTLVVFDSDGEVYALTPGEDANGFVARNRPAHIRDNNAIQRLCGVASPEPFPAHTVFSDRLVMWHSDIGSVVQEDIGDQSWQAFRAQADQELGQPGGLQKNGIHIALALSKAWDAGKRSPHLERLCNYILQLGAPAQAVTAAGAATTPSVAVPHIPPNIPTQKTASTKTLVN